MAVTSAFLALVIEAVLGYPPVLLRILGHPVTWMGALIATLERRFNRPRASARERRLVGLAGLAPWARMGWGAPARPSRISSGAILMHSMRQASRGPRSRAWQRTFPTALWHRYCGPPSAVWRPAQRTKQSTPPT